MSRAARYVVLASALVGSLAAPAGAQDTSRAQGVRIGLTYAPGTRPGVLIVPVGGANADSVRAILARDLDYGDRVNRMAPDSGDPPAGALNYPLYAQMGAVAVVQATVTPAGSLHVAVHEVGAARVMSVWDVALPDPPLGPDWRMAVHGASDEIERVITEQRGIAQTRIVYERAGSLWSVDSDGANPHSLPGTASALSPAWHPSGRYLAYCLLANDGQFVFLRDLVAGTSRKIPGRGASSNTPSFSPDGTTLVFSSGSDGSDIYTASAFGQEPLQRLTIGRGSVISQQPSFSPDGRHIAFQSDRSGHPEVYIMDTDGTNVDLLTTSSEGTQTYRSNPDWSPDGRKVAFQSQLNGAFQIMTINVRDRTVAGLTSEGRNEDPSWAPDGRHLVFASTRAGSKQLWVIDVESNRLRQLTHGDKARMGAWSPRLVSR